MRPLQYQALQRHQFHPKDFLRKCLKRVWEIAGNVAGPAMDMRHEPSSLFHGFDGGRVADSGTPGSAGAAGWPARQVLPPGGGECHPVRAAHRLCLASVASRPACLAIRLPLLLGLAASWDLAGDSRRAALHDAAVPGPPAQPQRGHHRQPVGADHGERGPRGTTRASRCKAANGILWWIPRDCCWRWRCTQPTCQTGMGQAGH